MGESDDHEPEQSLARGREEKRRESGGCLLKAGKMLVGERSPKYRAMNLVFIYIYIHVYIEKENKR